MRKYFELKEIDSIPKPVKKGFIAKLVEDKINGIGFYTLEKTEQLIEIEELKLKLLNTDYQALKYAEGHLSEEEYAPIKEERQAWRDKINELEASLEVQNEDNEI